jgi:hypothetical protein
MSGRRVFLFDLARGRLVSFDMFDAVWNRKANRPSQKGNEEIVMIYEIFQKPELHLSGRPMTDRRASSKQCSTGSRVGQWRLMQPASEKLR